MLQFIENNILYILGDWIKLITVSLAFDIFSVNYNSLSFKLKVKYSQINGHY